MAPPKRPLPVLVMRKNRTSITCRVIPDGTPANQIVTYQLFVGTSRDKLGTGHYQSTATFTVKDLKPDTLYYLSSAVATKSGLSGYSSITSQSQTYTDPGVYIFISGEWVQAIPYVKQNNTWRQALMYYRGDTGWKAR